MLELDEVYGFWHVSFWSTWLGLLVIALFILLALFLLFLIFKYFFTKHITNWQLASERLKRISFGIKDFKNYEQQQYFYVNATEILKNILWQEETILERKIDSGLTDEELILKLKKFKSKSGKSLSESLMTNLVILFEHGQVVKFAKKPVDSEKFVEDIHNVIGVLDLLKPSQTSPELKPRAKPKV